MGGLGGGDGRERLGDARLGLLVRAGQLEVDDDRAAVLGGDRALDAADALDPPQPRHDVLHGSAPLRPVSTLHEHPLVGLLGEVGGLDDHVAALGLAAAAS